jgi:hypothetical protein
VVDSVLLIYTKDGTMGAVAPRSWTGSEAF